MARQRQLYWEDVEVGNELTPLPQIATTQTLVKFCGAEGDFNPLHYEDTFAASQGVGKPILLGELKRGWLVQLITDWIGEQGDLRKLSYQFRGVDHPRLMKSAKEYQEGETWLCKGKVTKKYTEGDEHRVDCDIWLENGKGEVTTQGKVTVALPSRG